MKSKIYLKEKAVHGTALVPVAIHHLSYEQGMTNFFFLHWHFEFELVTVLEGGIIYTVEDQDYCLLAGEGLFIQSNQLHAARSYNGLPCEACVVVFHPNLFGANTQGTTYSKYVYPLLSGDISFTPILKRDPLSASFWQHTALKLLEDIDKLYLLPVVENELLLKSKLYEIWHLFFYYGQINNKANRDIKQYKLERMEPVITYIHQHYKEEISLLTLAQLLPMSEGQFCRAFKEVMNMTPIAYVIRYRILQSCILLANSNIKIADIARSIGFNNISYFNREFGKAIGCSPSHYRQEET